MVTNIKTKKVTKKETKHSPLLNLSGPVQEFVKKIKILKNIHPPDNRWGGGKWDHLIVRVEEGDCIELETKTAVAFSNRARSLGYVIVIRKYSDKLARVWFEGLDPNYKQKKVESGAKQ